MFECHTDTIYTIRNEGWGGGLLRSSSHGQLGYRCHWIMVAWFPMLPICSSERGHYPPHVPLSQYSTLFRGRVVGQLWWVFRLETEISKHAKLEKSFAELSQQVADANDTCWFLGCFCRGCGWPPIHLTSFLHLGCLVFVVVSIPWVTVRFSTVAHESVFNEI